MSKKSTKSESKVKIFVQPDDGIKPVLEALHSARKSIHILIFRIDLSEIEKALVEAAGRGVSVHALIAYTAQGGDKSLRKFEMRLLERGITVTRTADDLVRYHGKMFIIDEAQLYLLAFNFTHMDISLSRSFAARVDAPETVKEALRLFDCDSKRVPFESRVNELVVSPSNARGQLRSFIAGAKKQLLMYEMKISDLEFIRLLKEKQDAGLDVRILGRDSVKGVKIPARSLPIRLHARAIFRDGESAFLGSQSLRKLEMEARREIGVIFHDKPAVQKMIGVFEKDWKKGEQMLDVNEVEDALSVPARKVAKRVAKDLEMKPMFTRIINKAMDKHSHGSIDANEVAEAVRKAIRSEIQEAVKDALKASAIEDAQGGHLKG